MAAYTTSAGDVGVAAKATAANTVDTVTLQPYIGTIEIISDGAAALYVTLNGVVPTVAGNTSYVLPAVACQREFTLPASVSPSQAIVVRLISAGIVTYSVLGY